MTMRSKQLVDKGQQIAEPLGEQFHGSPPKTRQESETNQARTRPADHRRQGFSLADEVRYIQRQAANQHGRIVTVGPLILFSTETGDAWLLDPADAFRSQLARLGYP